MPVVPIHPARLRAGLQRAARELDAAVRACSPRGAASPGKTRGIRETCRLFSVRRPANVTWAVRAWIR